MVVSHCFLLKKWILLTQKCNSYLIKLLISTLMTVSRPSLLNIQSLSKGFHLLHLQTDQQVGTVSLKPLTSFGLSGRRNCFLELMGLWQCLRVEAKLRCMKAVGLQCSQSSQGSWFCTAHTSLPSTVFSLFLFYLYSTNVVPWSQRNKISFLS